MHHLLLLAALTPPARPPGDAFVLLGATAEASLVEMLGETVGRRRALRRSPDEERLSLALARARRQHRAASARVAALDTRGHHTRRALEGSSGSELARRKKERLAAADRIARLVGALRRARDATAAQALVLGGGAHGTVMLGRGVLSGSEVAIKVSRRGGGDSEALTTEARVLRALRRETGFPRPLYYGRQALRGEPCDVLVQEAVGPSIDALWWASSGGTALSPRCALRVACGALQRLASLHRLGYAHNDVSTSNLCAGAGGGAAQHEIHLVDFGSATPLPSSSTTAAGGDRERRDTDGGGGGGTPLFASAAAHGGGLCGAADDLESLAYVLSFLARGSLPWEHAPPADIPAAKRAATASQLSEGLPREAAVAVEALLRPPRGAGGEVDHAALLRTLRLAAGSDGGEEGEGEQGEGMDWQRLGLSWRADGAILDAGGELVRRPAG
mmetsp:Transcript_8937/g.26345  ORF Transcript_8937/g.26345 Transcript_8937/m.26345 type:complete len:446 (+) Transcript_8937:91-1428(+)